MSVKKTSEAEVNASLWYGHMGRKLMATLLGILLAYLIIYVGTLIKNNIRAYSTIGNAAKMERTLTVEAEGKVTITPNIAITTMGMTAEGKNVAEAQQKNTEVMNKLLEKVKALGVDKADVQTANYNIFPNYDYTDGKQTIRNYQVNQNFLCQLVALIECKFFYFLLLFCKVLKVCSQTSLQQGLKEYD